MIIDISSYNGKIDFDTLVKENDIERVIMRSTCKNGEPDSALAANITRLKRIDESIPIATSLPMREIMRTQYLKRLNYYIYLNLCHYCYFPKLYILTLNQ